MMDRYVRFFAEDRLKRFWAEQQRARTDFDTLAEEHRFLRSDDEDETALGPGARLARRYYDRLFREYAIVDLSRAASGAVGMRWRTEAEVLAGTGQFTCGAKRCGEVTGLCSYETHFVYREAGKREQALVKVRLCPRCAETLRGAKGKGKMLRKAVPRRVRSRDDTDGDGLSGTGTRKRRRAAGAESTGAGDEGDGAGAVGKKAGAPGAAGDEDGEREVDRGEREHWLGVSGQGEEGEDAEEGALTMDDFLADMLP